MMTITMLDLEEYQRVLFKKYGISEYGNTEKGYARITFITKPVKFEKEGNKIKYIYETYAECGIRTMGGYKVEEMLDASEEIKKIAELTEKYNNKVKDFKIVEIVNLED